VDFGKALEAIKDGKKVRRARWIKPSHLYYDFDHNIIINKFNTGTEVFDTTQFDVLAGDWEIVPDAPEVNSDEVLSKFREWLKIAIWHSCGTPGNGHPYLIKCMDKLDELSSSKPAGQKTPEKCEVKLIDGNHAVVETKSGKSIIVHLT